MPAAVVETNNTISSAIPEATPTSLSHIRVAEVKRSDSLRSQSSSASESKRVSFNNDVLIKRIPNKFKKPQLQQGQEVFSNFEKVSPPSDPKQIEAEAQEILRQLSLVECTVSSTQDQPPPPVPPEIQENQSHLHQQRSRTGSLDSCNPLYGLHALNNLDIAVNGKEVNSMPSYREIRRRGHDGSGGSDDNSYSGLDRYDSVSSAPPKPPRKAPSTSPPSLRRNRDMYRNIETMSNRNTDNESTHYARPATVMSSSSQSDPFRKRFADSNNDDSAIASGGDGGGTDDASGSNPSFLFNPHPQRSRPSPPRIHSPSRTCMTDTEILRSPTEVLYAVSEKRRMRDNSDVKSVSASVQTVHSELRQNPAGYYAKNPNRPSRNSSREDLLTDDATYVPSSRRSASLQQPIHRRTPTHNGSKYSHHAARSLERYLEDDKENAFKTRIQVISPERGQSPDPNRRKPYKTMINTATDNIIQYRVGSNENLRFTDYYTLSKDEGNEHYKVPKNKAPVIDEYYQRQQRRKFMYRDKEDSDLSSASYGPQHHRSAPGSRSQFTSSGLVKSVDSRRYRTPSSNRELDREGRSIRREGRHYSGCSTSPDREGSPERYARPMVTNSQYRAPVISPSPDVSPARPPRSRSSPVRELGRTLSRTGKKEGEEISRLRNGVNSLTREASISKPPMHRRRVSNGVEDSGEDRLAKFTEYRGDDVDSVSDRERGRSLPPGATIDSMRDFYKSSQFKSMYALPPSPSRPAPVLERSQSRKQRLSISEGEVTDEASKASVNRRDPGRTARITTSGPRPSTKRPAPSPPAAVATRRVVSSDRESIRTGPREGPRRVVASNTLTRRMIPGRRGSSVDGLESSLSESEGIPLESEQEKQSLGDFGRRWSGAQQSDIDSDYRRELATSGSGLHQEARSRDGGSGLVASSRISSSRNNIIRGDEMMVDEDEDQRAALPGVGTTAREEERRKVLEIEEERIRLEREAQLRRNVATGANGPNTARTARTAHVHSAALRRGGARMAGNDAEITYGPSGAPIYSSSPSKINRYDQHRSASRVRRTPSSAAGHTSSGVGVVRKDTITQRKKLPGGSLTSSVNSSESERGSHAGQSAVSRATEASRRSVYLHAAAVVDIPSASDRPPRAVSADHHPAPLSNAQSMSNLKNSKKISRSISLLSPWKPKNYKDKFEVIHYDNRSVYANPPTNVTVGPGGTTSASSGPASGRPPRPPPTSRRVVADKKSASSTDLLRDTSHSVAPVSQPSHASASSSTPASAPVLERRAQTLQKSKVSRSVSMPKDSRLAGWFKKRKRS